MTDQKTTEFAFLEAFTAELSAKKLVFPTSLSATMKIRKALSQPDISTDMVARIIGTEPVLSAKVLYLSNSVMFNPQGRKIGDLRAATNLLGFSAIRNIAISIGMKQLAENKYNGSLSAQMDGLWRRSLRVAALSMVIARTYTRLSADKAMLAGLLHDIGKFYILNRANHYQELFSSEQVLWDLIDHWHASIGSAILEDWEISEDIRVAVLDHRDHQPGATHKIALIDVVVVADFLDAHFVDESIAELDWNTVPASFKVLNIDKDNIDALMQETRTELALVLKAIN
ncbi:HDOD domain-containing protein [Undibacterium umbellatum]|uniref:HDOD domain-containing protein n=1 Tax=Undibacterium umbellatum TaxID=2762300 RepID=A0ABR6ZDH1_9BURK|nr:HDOD domain-containing protein [Undibacterium umbellatum]MBC3909798.1 HDOD domain-containing protein [Undibacterium umbellatum]